MKKIRNAYTRAIYDMKEEKKSPCKPHVREKDNEFGVHIYIYARVPITATIIIHIIKTTTTTTTTSMTSKRQMSIGRTFT